MNERTRRIWAATEARTIGRGGITIVSRATGLARTVVDFNRERLEKRLRQTMETLSKDPRKVNIRQQREPG